MMMATTRPARLLAAALLTAGLAAACEGDSGAECGPGTTERGGRCVPDVEECGAGTEMVDGECRPACSPDEFWDVAAETCRSRCGDGTLPGDHTCDARCPAGEYWDGQACATVPDCATPGTVFDPATGACVPAPEVCGPGTHLADGACVPDELLSCGAGTELRDGECVPTDAPPDPDVTESPDDGVAAEFILPAEGEQLILGGVLDAPTDPNNQGASQGDWDDFAFHAAAGTWLRITATSSGAARPAVQLVSAAVGPGGGPLFTRYGVETTSGTVSREVFLPRDGDYVLSVTQAGLLLATIFDPVTTLSVGGEDFPYHVVVENLGAPTPTPLAALPASETGKLHDGGLRFFSLPALDPDQIVLASSSGQPVDDEGSDTFPALLVMDPDGALVREALAYSNLDPADLIFPAVTGGEGYLLVQDIFLTIGPLRDFAVDVQGLAAIDCTAGGCETGSLAEGENRLLRWDLTEGDLLVVGVYHPWDSYDATRAWPLGPDLAPVMEESLAYYAGVGFGHWYAEAASTAYLWLRGWDMMAVEEHTVDARVHATPELEDGRTNNALPVFPMPEFTLNPPGVAHVQGMGGRVVFFTDLSSYAPSLGSAWNDPQQLLMSPRLEPIGPIIDTNAWNFPDGFVTPLFTYLPDDGHYLHYVYDATTDLTDALYGVKVDSKAVTALGAPAPDAPLTLELQGLGGGLAFYTIDGHADEFLDITVTPTGDSDLQAEVWVLNFGRAVFDWVMYIWQTDPDSRQLGLVETALAADLGEPVTAGYRSPYDGESLILVMDEGGQATAGDLFTVEVSVPAPPPNDTCAAAEALALDAGGQAVVTARTSSATSSVDNPGCTEYPTPGRDVFYALDLAAGETLSLLLEEDHAGFSPALYLFTDCAAVRETCLAAVSSGTPRELAFTVPDGGGGTYLLAVDGHGPSGGPFTLTVTVTGP